MDHLSRGNPEGVRRTLPHVSNECLGQQSGHIMHKLRRPSNRCKLDLHLSRYCPLFPWFERHGRNVEDLWFLASAHSCSRSISLPSASNFHSQRRRPNARSPWRDLVASVLRLTLHKRQCAGTNTMELPCPVGTIRSFDANRMLHDPTHDQPFTSGNRKLRVLSLCSRAREVTHWIDGGTDRQPCEFRPGV